MVTKGAGSGRTGRRSGSSRSRDDILDAARRLFAEHGYAGTSLRAIASQAGVDVALVGYFFGGKDGLFETVLALPPVVLERVSAAFDGDPQRVGERLVRTYLRVWEDDDTAPAAHAMLRSAVAHESAAALLRSFVEGRVLAQAVTALGEESRARAVAAGSQLIGLAVARYVVKVEPLATMSVEEVVALVGPTIQHYLSASSPTPTSPTHA